MQYGEFVRSAEAQQRYWARPTSAGGGWATPTPTTATGPWWTWSRPGLMGVMTQNVDGLHSRPAAATVINLHGDIAGWSAWTAGTGRRGPTSSGG